MPTVSPPPKHRKSRGPWPPDSELMALHPRLGCWLIWPLWAWCLMPPLVQPEHMG